RLSSLYEYHSAPEVAPAHGLEYDDTVYPTSDKCPVVNQLSDPPPYTGSHDPVTKPPRIIFGMKVRMFIIVAILFICVIVGAAVGGAMGGKNMHGGSSSNRMMSGDSSIATSAAPQTVVTSIATPTYYPFSDCPACNDTTYSSTYSAALTFTKHCNVESPLSDTALSVTNITEAFVYTFDDCIEICAGYNHYSSSQNCTVAIYAPTARRPADCWIAKADLNDTRTLTMASGIAVALLKI
ncbi:hypothetical protein BDV97DRAFT_295806, partial [Delphinella strobiligena]